MRCTPAKLMRETQPLSTIFRHTASNALRLSALLPHPHPPSSCYTPHSTASVSSSSHIPPLPLSFSSPPTTAFLLGCSKMREDILVRDVGTLVEFAPTELPKPRDSAASSQSPRQSAHPSGASSSRPAPSSLAAAQDSHAQPSRRRLSRRRESDYEAPPFLRNPPFASNGFLISSHLSWWMRRGWVALRSGSPTESGVYVISGADDSSPSLHARSTDGIHQPQGPYAPRLPFTAHARPSSTPLPLAYHHPRFFANTSLLPLAPFLSPNPTSQQRWLQGEDDGDSGPALLPVAVVCWSCLCSSAHDSAPVSLHELQPLFGEAACLLAVV